MDPGGPQKVSEKVFEFAGLEGTGVGRAPAERAAALEIQELHTLIDFDQVVELRGRPGFDDIELRGRAGIDDIELEGAESSLDSLRLYLRSIGRVPLLSAAEEVCLAKRIE